MFASLAMFASEVIHVESPHAFLPETKEMIFGIPAFGLVLAVLIWKVLPAAQTALRNRRLAIERAFADATARKESAQASAKELTGGISSSDAEVEAILTEARTQADQVKATIEAHFAEEAEALRERHANELKAIKAQAELDLRTQLADNAISRAESILRSNLDASTQQTLISSFISEVSR